MGVISKLARKEQRARNRHARALERLERVRAQLADERAELQLRQRKAMAGLLDAAALVLRAPLDIPERVDSPDAPVTVRMHAPGGVVVQRVFRRDQLPPGGLRFTLGSTSASIEGVTPPAPGAVLAGHGETGRNGKG